MVQTLFQRFPKSAVLWFALLFGCGIAILSVVPINRIAVGTRPHYFAPAAAVHQAAVFHMTIHVIIFGITALVAWFAAESAAESAATAVINKMIAIVLTLLLGCTTEWLQHTVYQQALELNDVYINVAASSIVFAVLLAWSVVRKRMAKPPAEDNAFILRDLD